MCTHRLGENFQTIGANKRSISDMAYGGTNVNPLAATGGSTTVRQVKLEKECELRVEASADSPLRLRLLTGTAEIFGTEIPPGIWLNFPPRLKFAV
ncbi:hypothetical protein MTR67_000788 [Solanum verrucosum]|uniref:Clp1 N-terminal domain-containing protein n=1 Tax=Solanum verrucosum TaxID=315347 RepID=A0AAF0T7T1_SOLVR|nr:hypothetical protein MTR67_000788 [Solanum verrucosum]